MREGYYLVRPTSHEAREALVDHLEKQGYKYINGDTRESTLETIFPIGIDTIEKTIWHLHTITSAAASAKFHISEDEFYEKTRDIFKKL